MPKNNAVIRWIAFALFAVLSSSCAYHARLTPVIKVPDFYEFKTKVGFVEAAIDPYEQPYKINYLFSSDITEKGILPVHVIIWNQGTDTLDLRSVKTKLVSLGNGMVFEPMIPQEVTKQVKHNTAARMLGFGAMGTALIFFTVPFAAGGGIDSYVANKSIEKDYAQKELKREQIEAHSVFHGFLFFDLGASGSSGHSPFDESAYYFYLSGVKNLTTNKTLNFRIRFELNHG